MRANLMLLRITPNIAIPLDEVQIEAVRAQGPGGQHVNKAATAVHLRFDIEASSLPEAVKARLRGSHDQRITEDGVVVIKAQRYRSQGRNRDDAIARLREMICLGSRPPKARKATRPSREARRRRLEAKRHRSRIKQWRHNPQA